MLLCEVDSLSCNQQVIWALFRGTFVCIGVCVCRIQLSKASSRREIVVNFALSGDLVEKLNREREKKNNRC